jgi:hypothetical protein
MVIVKVLAAIFLIGVATILFQQTYFEDKLAKADRENKVLAHSNLKNNKMIDRITEQFPDEDFLVADGFDEAIIGVDTMSMRLIYSVTKCISILCLDEGMEVEDAIEHFEYNVRGSYMGEKTPIWCDELNF